MIKPKKQLGQNFLKSPEIVNRIVAAAKIKSTDTVIEIGPGTGILTDKLFRTGAKIFAVEKDGYLAIKLQKRYVKEKNIKIIHQDALWFNLETIPTPYKVVANIPYNITSPIIRKFLEGENTPSLMILMVQKEVAERICAKPGESKRGLLTIIVEYYSYAEILFEVSRKEFFPVPRVDSAVVKIKTKDEHKSTKSIDPKFFFRIVKAGFSAKRRQIHNSLAATLQLEKNIVFDTLKKAKINPTFRAEDLTFDDWQRLADQFYIIYQQ